MILPQVHSDCSSQGEREIFRRLKSDPQNRGWIVLHSLDVSDHITKIAGEIDFIVIIPERGVLWVEVKGCSSLSRIDGLWFYGRHVRPDPRGPFKQASTAMHSIRVKVATQKPELARIPFWSDVIFPYLEFSIDSGEWHKWQVIDSLTFLSANHAFKGMESPAVIVTDIDGLDGSSSTTLFYVAITRVLQRLIILAHDSVKADILRTLLDWNQSDSFPLREQDD